MNKDIKNRIFRFLAKGSKDGYTPTQLVRQLNLGNTSSVTTPLKQLIAEEKVKRVKERGKVMYSINPNLYESIRTMDGPKIQMMDYSAIPPMDVTQQDPSIYPTMLEILRKHMHEMIDRFSNKNLLTEFWQRSSDACPLDADEEERQEVAFKEWLMITYPGIYNFGKVVDQIDLLIEEVKDNPDVVYGRNITPIINTLKELIHGKGKE